MSEDEILFEFEPLPIEWKWYEERIYSNARFCGYFDKNKRILDQVVDGSIVIKPLR